VRFSLQKCPHVGLGEVGVFFDDHQLHRLAGLGVRHAHGRRTPARRANWTPRLPVSVGKHVEAADQDHVLLAVDDFEEAALVDHTDVAAS